MIIERSKSYKIYVYGITIFVILNSLVMGFRFGLSSLALFIPLYVAIVADFISKGRAFILDEEGCTVCFGQYRKKYFWNDMKTKRVEEHLALYSIYTKEVIFSSKIIHKPKFIRPEFYCILHPFSCIYINFNPQCKDFIQQHFEADEKEFFALMDQWNVEIDNYKNIK